MPRDAQVLRTAFLRESSALPHSPQLLAEGLSTGDRVVAEEADDGREIRELGLGSANLPAHDGVDVDADRGRHLLLLKPLFQPSRPQVVSERL